MTTIAAYGSLLESDKLNSVHAKSCCFQYDEAYEQLFCLYQIPQQQNNVVVGFKQFYYFKCYVYERVQYYNQQSEKSMKLLHDFVIKNTSECDESTVLPLDDLALYSGACKVTYHVLDLFNTVVNMQIADKYTEKICLLSFHVQTSSVIKLQATCQIYRQHSLNDESIVFNHNLMGVKLATFVKQCMNIQSNDGDIDQLNLYQHLAYHRNKYLNQPHIFTYKGFQLWIVPNVEKELCSVFLIKIMPYVPIEHVHTFHIPLFKVEYKKQFQLLSKSDPGTQEINTAAKSIYDIDIQNAPYDELCYQLGSNEIALYISQQTGRSPSDQPLAQKQKKADQSHDQNTPIHMLSPNLSFNNSFIGSNTQENNNHDNQSKQKNSGLDAPCLQNKQLNGTRQKTIDTPHSSGIFEQNATTLCFTQNETALYFLLTHIFSHKNIYDSNNYIIQQKQIQQMHQSYNSNINTFTQNKEQQIFGIQNNEFKLQIRYYNTVNNQISQICLSSNFNFQNSLDTLAHIKICSKHINFFTDICMFYSQSIDFQTLQYIELCSQLFGTTYGNLLKQYYEQINDKTNRQINMMIQLMISFVQNGNSVNNNFQSQSQSYVQVYEAYTSVIQQLLRQIFTSVIIIKQLNKNNQKQAKKSFEFFMAEYIMNTFLSVQLQVKRHTAQITKMHSYNSCNDYSDRANIHPLKKQQQQTIQIQQYIYQHYVAKHKEFYEMLYLQQESLINNASPQYQRLIYFVNLSYVLDNYQRYIDIMDALYVGQQKQIAVELNRHVTGSHVLMNIFGELQFLIMSYQTFIHNEMFTNLFKQSTNKHILNILIYYISQLQIQTQAQNYIMLYNQKHQQQINSYNYIDKMIVPQYIYDNLYTRSQKLGAAFLLGYSYTDPQSVSPEIHKIIHENPQFSHYQNNIFSFWDFITKTKFQFQRSIFIHKQLNSAVSVTNIFDTNNIVLETSNNSAYTTSLARNISLLSSLSITENSLLSDTSFQNIGNSAVNPSIDINNSSSKLQPAVINGQLNQLIQYQQNIISVRIAAYSDIRDVISLYKNQRMIKNLNCDQKYNQMIKCVQKYQLQNNNLHVSLQRQPKTYQQ